MGSVAGTADDQTTFAPPAQPVFPFCGSQRRGLRDAVSEIRSQRRGLRDRCRSGRRLFDQRLEGMKMRKNVTLWVVQGLLAALFLFAGVMKLVLPVEAMAGPVAVPGLFLRFIGVCEALGAVGLILPGLLRVHQELTPVAAA